jgi:predicted nucleic acid binding AN1-type Zn finger protein
LIRNIGGWRACNKAPYLKIICEDEEKSTNDPCTKETYEATCLLTVIKAEFIGSVPIRVIEHHITIVMIRRISSHASIIQVPDKVLFTAGFHCAG